VTTLTLSHCNVHETERGKSAGGGKPTREIGCTYLPIAAGFCTIKHRQQLALPESETSTSVW